MARVLNDTLPAGTRGLWWFAQGLENLGSVYTGIAELAYGATLEAGGYLLHDTTSEITFLAPLSSMLLPTTAITIMFDLRSTDTVLRGGAIVGVDSGGQVASCGAQVPASNGRVTWDFGDQQEGTTRLSVAYTKDTSRHVWALTTGARGMEIWRDGVKIASNAATPTRAASDMPWEIGRHFGGYSDLFEMRWVFVHETQLSEAQIAAISADPEGTLTQEGTLPVRPFEPAHWVDRGTPMPSYSVDVTGVIPNGAWVQFKEHLYVGYAGTLYNQSGYPYPNMRVQAGYIVRTTDGVAWTQVWAGPGAGMGQRDWAPGQMFVIGETLYCFISAAIIGVNDSTAQIADGEIALMKTTNGTTWTKIHTFHSWPASSYGTGRPQIGIVATAWHARRSSAGGDDWCIVGWHVSNPGSTGTFLSKSTRRYRSADLGATWTDVGVEMKGVYPFTSNPDLVEAPDGVMAVWRSETLGDRWLMFGGTNGVNWSDDEGATWTAMTYFGHFIRWGYPLGSGGLVFFNHGSSGSGPDVKVSCNLGVSAVFATRGPASGVNSFVATLQFPITGLQGEGGEELLALVSPGTAVWWSQNGGEYWVKQGVLPTSYTVPTFLGRTPNGRAVLWTRAGFPQVRTCDDAPLGVLGARTICLDLTPVEPEPEPPRPVVLTPVQAGVSRLSLRVTAAWRPR